MYNSNTALVVVDMQNAFCSENGSYQQRGNKLIDLDLTLENIQKMLSHARKFKQLIIFTRLVFKSDYSDAGKLVQKFPEILANRAYIEDTFDVQIADQLEPKDNEFIINKKRYDPFLYTDMENILKNHKMENLIVCGVLTNVCVESTVRSAFERGFNIKLVTDATTTYSQDVKDNSIFTQRKHFCDTLLLKNMV